IGINAPYSSTGEFICGRIYEYKGNEVWEESRKSAHLSAAQKDALQISKDTGTYMFVAVLVAQLGLFHDLLVAALLRSTNYSENADGVPTSGFLLDGIRGLIKVLGLEAYEATIYGNLIASGFKTLQEETGTTIAAASITPTLWKHSEMEALIADQDTLAVISGTVDGYSFTKAARRNNKRILLASHGYESETISADETHLFTILYPSLLFGRTFYCKFKGYYEGYKSSRGYWANGSGFIRAFKYAMSTSYTIERSFPLNEEYNETGFYITHSSQALWGSRGSHVDYHQVWTNEIFTGLVLVDGEASYHSVSSEPNAYYPNTKTWQIGSISQTDKDNYCSGTDFYNLFSALSIGSDGFCDGGQVNINGALYNVTRLIKNTNSITFYTSAGIITVNKFQEGSPVGVYTQLAITQSINFQAVAGGIETKHIFPWGTQSGNPGNYDIGTSAERFNTLWIRILDVLNSARVRGSMTVDNGLTVGGSITGANINTGQGVTEVHQMNQNLRTTDSPTFNQIITQLGPNKPESNPRVGGFTYRSASASNRATATVTTPSGGTYMYVGKVTIGNSVTTLMGTCSGGTTFSRKSSSEDNAYVLVLFWRI
ncbi:MAG: hypothetical protein ACQ5SW_10515, partial [Sphaerochaetaceae bacterium]